MATEKELAGNRRRNRKHYQATKEQHKQYRDAYRQAHPARCILARAKNRARSLGVPFSLVESDILPLPTVCPVLGIEMKWFQTGHRGYFPDSVSLDRMIPSLGYVPGNIRVISNRANILKSNAVASELRAVLAYIEEIERGLNI